jgi:hypothetical protein
VLTFKVDDFEDTLTKLKQYGAKMENQVLENENRKVNLVGI